MIPVCFKTTDFTEPAASLYYLVTADGNFLVRKTGLFASVTEARVIPGLLEQRESLTLNLPRVPRSIMERMYDFFDAVHTRWGGEAIVFLYYSPEKRSFRLAVPPQTLFRYQTISGFWRTEMRVVYGWLPRPEGFIKLGDAHSHGDLPAFFSCTDDKDDRDDGLRITLGRLDRSRPDVEVSFVVNGTRFILNPEDALEDFFDPVPPPPEWLERVTCQMEDSGSGRKAENDGQQDANCEAGR